MNRQFKGFELFDDVEDSHLRNRNRAVVLANIAEDYKEKNSRNISPKGAAIILGYFNEVPEKDREEVKNKFADNMKERGFVIAR